MDETTPSTKVTILSDIILNPTQSLLQNGSPTVALPLSSLSNKSNAPVIFSKSTNSNIIQTNTEECLKRKTDNDFTSQVIPKKPKFEVTNKNKDQIDLNEDEIIFNYMTGTYEKVRRVESPENTGSVDNTDIESDEVKIEENSLKSEEIAVDLQPFQETENEGEIKVKEESKSEPQEKPNLDDSKPTVTIDLTVEDDTDQNIEVRNNIFIQNVLSLHNAITLQNLNTTIQKPDSDSKIPLQNNIVIENQNSPLKSGQITQDPGAILQNSVKLANETNVNQPMVVMVQNNQTFVVPQNMVGANNPIQNNIRLIPDNLNIHNNLVLETSQIYSKNVANNEQKRTLHPVKTPIKLISQTYTDSPQNVKNSSQIFKDSEQKLENASQNFKNSSLIPITTTEKLKHTSQKPPNNIAQNPTISSQNFWCHSCSHRSSSKSALDLHIYHEHLKDYFTINFKCKICDFNTNVQSVMEKHDLNHRNDLKNQENSENDVSLSENIEIRFKTIRDIDKNLIAESCISNHLKSITKTIDPVDVIDLADSDDESAEENNLYRCFDCKYRAKTIKSLTNHALHHIESIFQCPKHAEITKSCTECIYQKCLLESKNTTFVCTKCGYKTSHKDSYDSHLKNCSLCEREKEHSVSNDSESESNENSKQFRCFHCSYTTQSLEFLKCHAVTHYGDSFECDIHKHNQTASCSKCIYGTILKDLTQTIFSCSDCGFTTLSSLAYYKHKSEKRNCNFFRKHSNVKTALKFSPDNVLSMQHCQVNRVSKKNDKVLSSIVPPPAKIKVSRKSATSESGSTDTEGEEISGDFKCFHCTYLTTCRDLLKYHVVKHSEENFQCNIHPHSTTEGCEKCSYQTILSELKKEVLLCQDCGFKTLRQPTYDRHRNNLENCDKYRKQRYQETGELSESDIEMKYSDTESLDGSSPKKNINSQEIPVLNAAKLILICAVCNYRTSDRKIFKFHEQLHETPGSAQLLNGETLLNCFDCNEFCTEDPTKLKEHSVMHYRKRFSCDKHAPDENVTDCGKCLYLLIKEDMKKEVMICKKCSFKTLRKDIFEQHNISNLPCKSLGKTVEDADDDYNADNDIQNDLVEEKDVTATNSRVAAQNSVIEVDDNDDCVIEIDEITKNTDRPKRSSIYNFKCFDCGLQYVHQSDLEKHIVAHRGSSFRCDHPTFNDKCKKCVYQYILEKTLRRKILSCKCCGYKSNDLEVMRNHIKSNVKCEELSKKLSKENKKHDEQKYLCFDCGKQFDTRFKLWYHAYCHKSNFKCKAHRSSRDDCASCFYADIQESIHPRIYKCVECPNKVYRSEFNLRHHIEVNHSNSVFKNCDIHGKSRRENCPKCFSVWLVLRLANNRTVRCGGCKGSIYEYKNWKSLMNHIKTKHPDSDKPCLIHVNEKLMVDCNKCLFDRILAHFRSTGKRWQCYDCPKVFASRDSLRLHVRIFHEDSKFQCTAHALGNIDDGCGMCAYESVVVSIHS